MLPHLSGQTLETSFSGPVIKDVRSRESFVKGSTSLAVVGLRLYEYIHVNLKVVIF